MTVFIIDDPGNSGVIAPVEFLSQSTVSNLQRGIREIRVVSDPTHSGQQLSLICDTIIAGGIEFDITLKDDLPHKRVSFFKSDEAVLLHATPALEWEPIVNNGASLTRFWLGFTCGQSPFSNIAQRRIHAPGRDTPNTATGCFAPIESGGGWELFFDDRVTPVVTGTNIDQVFADRVCGFPSGWDSMSLGTMQDCFDDPDTSMMGGINYASGWDSYIEEFGIRELISNIGPPHNDNEIRIPHGNFNATESELRANQSPTANSGIILDRMTEGFHWLDQMGPQASIAMDSTTNNLGRESLWWEQIDARIANDHRGFICETRPYAKVGDVGERRGEFSELGCAYYEDYKSGSSQTAFYATRGGENSNANYVSTDSTYRFHLWMFKSSATPNKNDVFIGLVNSGLDIQSSGGLLFDPVLSEFNAQSLLDDGDWPAEWDVPFVQTGNAQLLADTGGNLFDYTGLGAQFLTDVDHLGPNIVVDSGFNVDIGGVGWLQNGTDWTISSSTAHTFF